MSFSSSGGVLLATTFLHLLPEINHTIVWLKDDGLIPELNVNLGELLMMIGFFLIYLIEELVHNYLHRHQHKIAKAAESKDVGGAFIRGVSARNSAIMKGFPDIQNSASHLVSEASLENHKDHEAGHGHSHIVPLPHSEGEDNLVSTLRGLLIVLALSIHELFEGFAVGLETTSASKLITIKDGKRSNFILFRRSLLHVRSCQCPQVCDCLLHRR